MRKFAFEYNLSAYPGVKDTFYCLDILLSNVFNKNSIDQAKCLFIIKLIHYYYNLCFSGFSNTMIHNLQFPYYTRRTTWLAFNINVNYFFIKRHRSEKLLLFILPWNAVYCTEDNLVTNNNRIPYEIEKKQHNRAA